MPYDWSNPYDSTGAYDVGNPQFIAAIGIVSAETFGALSVTSGGTLINLIGISSAQAFGATLFLSPISITLVGIPSAEVFGITVVTSPAVITLKGISSSESFGLTTVTTGVVTNIPKLVQSAQNSSISGNVATIAFTTQNITLGNFIVLSAAVQSPETIQSVTDTAGNIYSQAITNINSGLSTVTIWYASITAGGGTIPTVSITTGGTGLVYSFLYEFSGINKMSPIDVPAVGSASGISGTNVTSGPLTTFYSADLLVGICACASNVTAPEAGWLGFSGRGNSSIESEIFVTTSSGTYSATFTQTTASAYNAALASFAPASLLPNTAARIL